MWDVNMFFGQDGAVAAAEEQDGNHNNEGGGGEEVEEESNNTRQEELENKIGAGVLIRTLKAGDATNFPKKGDTCRVHYEGFLTDGKKFDSSRDRSQAFLFRLGMEQVIEGWDVAVAQMSRGQLAQITIPYIYAYGEGGYPPIIPPKSTLIFEIELIDFTSL